ncbi:hypothetical protein SAMN04488118_108183 [Epibacterium ulvae]|uniref:Cyclopropane-fatty-acyl-phospholipid synthase n=1 Tax=Epibacterium ulvae TaxID=1156985 RepID=A0A1G5R6J2_9RHOB|nr:DUF1365 domain-containing protein [Epibacterium ulvae]SCZ69041.1 hypothetical protein SAMN04488118_108183 [Epibacterium ulvae]
MIEHIAAQTYHRRQGALHNAFTYGVDFVLTDLTEPQPGLISKNRFNLWSLHDRHHGGPRGKGQGLPWFQEVLKAHDFPVEQAEFLLLTQPSLLWFHFNPVSFWIALIDGKPCAFVAEVNNTFGHRHCYFCALDGFRSIQERDVLHATKIMHVSPFQQVAGTYQFQLAYTEDDIKIRIDYKNQGEGVLATLSGKRRPATNRSLLYAAMRRPFGAVRVIGLIYWQALKLWIKRAPFLKTPPPPKLPLSSQITHDTRDPS